MVISNDVYTGIKCQKTRAPGNHDNYGGRNKNQGEILLSHWYKGEAEFDPKVTEIRDSG